MNYNPILHSIMLTQTVKNNVLYHLIFYQQNSWEHEMVHSCFCVRVIFLINSSVVCFMLEWPTYRNENLLYCIRSVNTYAISIISGAACGWDNILMCCCYMSTWANQVLLWVDKYVCKPGLLQTFFRQLSNCRWRLFVCTLLKLKMLSVCELGTVYNYHDVHRKSREINMLMTFVLIYLEF